MHAYAKTYPQRMWDESHTFCSLHKVYVYYSSCPVQQIGEHFNN